jgi:hypothetical protein
MKSFPLWLAGALVVTPIVAAAQPMATPMPASSAASSGYQSVFKDYVRSTPAAMSADKAWLEANRTVRDVDQMGMGAMPSMKPSEATVPATLAQGKAPDPHAGHQKHNKSH